MTGRFWVFYSDGTNMVYSTSTDGLNWAGPTIIRACSRGLLFGIWFDETYLHYAYSRGDVTNTPLYYRRGTPNADGSITWSAIEQTAIAGALGIAYFYPVVTVDSNGYAWIAYTRWSATGLHPFVITSDNNDGTWSGAEAPYQLSTVSATLRFSSVIPLTGGEMLAIYAGRDLLVNARLWNGAIWGNEVSTNSKVWYARRHSAVAEVNDVHLVFTSISNRLTYVKYHHSSNSFMDEKVLIEPDTSAPPVICIAENNNLYVFWGSGPEANTLYYLIYTAENDTWGPAVKWKSEERLYANALTCFYKQYSGYIGVLYTAKPTGPYEVKFNYIAPPPPPGSSPAPGEPGSPGAPEPTPEPEVDSSILTTSGSRHTTPEEGQIGTSQSFSSTRITRHITWVPVTITRV